LVETGAGTEGGWAWLIARDGVLSVVKTGHARAPSAPGVSCLLAVDVWEHPYYLGYGVTPLSGVASALDKIINWDFAAANFAKADRPAGAASA
jgi:Fe-Mn family superoxide dismutase